MQEIINKYNKYIVTFFLTFLSVYCLVYFFANNQLLLYGDSLSRMNISRKIIDNLTPGLAQLGNVWLPLPQMLMLPFIWNSYLWHTGIAGAIVSVIAYIIGGVYLYKSAKMISESILASIFALSIYALNINLLYLQTTAMSETIFLCSIILSIYYFLKWIRSKNKIPYLMMSALAIGAATLIRYEALSLLIASIPLVFYYSWVNTKNYHKAEGNTIMFTLLASLGFIIWTLYLGIIFGDPFYWKNYYAGSHTIISATGQPQNYGSQLNFFQASWKYFTSVVWMNGLIPTLLAFFALPVVYLDYKKNKSYDFMPILLSLAMFGFMVLTLQRNTQISQPNLTLSTILSSQTSKYLEFNIRYGIIMLPVVALLTVYLFRIRFMAVKILIYALFLIQLISYFYPAYSVIYQLPISIAGNTTQGTPKEKAMMYWLKSHYDKGFIMISALKHDPQMLQLGYNYRTYIHEGTGKYWRESKKSPQRYASWIVFDAQNADDQVAKYLKNSKTLKSHFNLVYDVDGMKIYKIKTKPDIVI